MNRSKVFPYVALALLIVGIAVFLVVRLVTDSLYLRAQSQLIGAGRFVAEVMVDYERERLAALRAVTNTQGVPQALAAVDSDRLAALLPQIIINSQDTDVVSLVNEEGDEVFSWRQRGLDSGERVEGQGFTDIAELELVLQEYEDDRGARHSALREQEDGWVLYTIGPIYDNGRLVGAALVGSDIGHMLSTVTATGLADVTLHTPQGDVIATTLGPPQQVQAALGNSAAGTRSGEAGADGLSERYEWIKMHAAESVPIEQVTVSNQRYLLAYGDWRVRDESIGYYSVAMPGNLIVPAAASSRNLLSLVFSLGTVALFVGIGLVLGLRFAGPTDRMIILTGLLLGLLIGTLVIVTTTFLARPQAAEPAAVSLLSDSSANYHAALPGGPLFAPLEPSILGQILVDEQTLEPAETGNAPAENESETLQLPDILDMLRGLTTPTGPGPTQLTATRPGTPTPSGRGTATASPTGSPSLTTSPNPGSSPTTTLAGTPGQFSSATPSRTPSSTPQAGSTAASTIPASNTPSNTATHIPLATMTSVATIPPPASATAPSPPVPPTPTNTPVSATATSPPAPATSTAPPIPPAPTNTPVPPSPTVVPTATETPIPERQSVSPGLACVRDNGDGSHTAVWGYHNPNSFTVDISIGGQNHFVPGPQAQGQPTSFAPGSHGGFSTTFSSNKSQAWKLDGQEASANAGSSPCS